MLPFGRFSSKRCLDCYSPSLKRDAAKFLRWGTQMAMIFSVSRGAKSVAHMFGVQMDQTHSTAQALFSTHTRCAVSLSHASLISRLLVENQETELLVMFAASTALSAMSAFAAVMETSSMHLNQVKLWKLHLYQGAAIWLQSGDTGDSIKSIISYLLKISEYLLIFSII